MRQELLASISDTRYSILAKIDQILFPSQKVDFFGVIGGREKIGVFYMQLKVSSKLPLSVKLTDKFGNPAVVDGTPVWSLTNPSLGNLTVAEDGYSAELAPIGPVGSLKVQISADADLGDGVKTIFGELPVDLIAGDAATIVIEAGEPVPVE